MTTTPAEKLGLGEKLGTLEEGKSAHLFISDGDYFDKQSQVLSVWIDDDEFIINDQPDVDIRGAWHLVDTNNLDSLIFSGDAISPTGKAFQDTAKIQLKGLSNCASQS